MISNFFRDWILFSLSSAISVAGTARAQTIPVVGWPLMEHSSAEILEQLQDDPIIGRLACPPLTRLNLRSQKVDELLLKEVKSEPRRWRMQLRSGLTWWNGDAVSAKDLSDFIEKNISGAVLKKGGGLWAVPSFNIVIRDHHTVTVEWQEPPLFGPFVFNGVPFSRALIAQKDRQFECVGLYQLKSLDGAYELQQRANLKTKLPVLRVQPKISGPEIPREAPFFLFKMPMDFSGNPWTRPGDTQANCEATIDLPAATMIVWNTSDGPTKNPDFRRILTHLVPRGPLLRAGGAGLGELLTAPIARRHPGYNQELALRPSDLELASKRLDQLGYKRSAAGMMRKLSEFKNELTLAISEKGQAFELIEKVVVDAFQAVGLGVRVVSIPEFRGGNQWDGMLSTFALDWPDSNLLGSFHSQLSRNNPNNFFPNPKDADLDLMLERYALSLTHREPNFSILSMIHARLYELELVTVVMQHKICLETSGRLKFTKNEIDSRDPDWFRHLVLPANTE